MKRHTNPFRSITSSQVLGGLSHHTAVLNGMAHALIKVMRERRLLLALHAVEVLAIIWLAVR